VIVGAAALLELELGPLPTPVAAALLELKLGPVPAPVAPDGNEELVILSLDESDVVEGAAAFVGSGPAVSVTSCPALMPAPPSVKLVTTSDIVVIVPPISAVPSPEQAPFKLEKVHPMLKVLKYISSQLSFGRNIHTLEHRCPHIHKPPSRFLTYKSILSLEWRQVLHSWLGRHIRVSMLSLFHPISLISLAHSPSLFSTLTDVTTEPMMLWDVNPRRNRLMTDCWAKTAATTASTANADLCILELFHNISEFLRFE